MLIVYIRMFVVAKVLVYGHYFDGQCGEFVIILSKEDEVRIIAKCSLTVNNNGKLVSAKVQTVFISFDVHGPGLLKKERQGKGL